MMTKCYSSSEFRMHGVVEVLGHAVALDELEAELAVPGEGFAGEWRGAGASEAGLLGEPKGGLLPWPPGLSHCCLGS